MLSNRRKLSWESLLAIPKWSLFVNYSNKLFNKYFWTIYLVCCQLKFAVFGSDTATDLNKLWWPDTAIEKTAIQCELVHEIPDMP